MLHTAGFVSLLLNRRTTRDPIGTLRLQIVLLGVRVLLSVSSGTLVQG